MFAVQVYLVGAWWGWWGGDSFGNRMLISSFPALALGLAALLDWAIEHNAFSVAGILGCSLVAWNALFFVQYRLGYIPKNETITFSQLTLGKFTMLLDIANRIRAVIR